jgi:hypothetical protein
LHIPIFQRNYFFHCAFCRYEAGLSIDEIWSENQPAPSEATAAGPRDEETIVFDHPTDDKKPAESVKVFPAEPVTDADAPFGKETNSSADEHESSSPAASTTEYDMVGDNFDQDLAAGLDDIDSGVDYELDELEAEIARELED